MSSAIARCQEWHSPDGASGAAAIHGHVDSITYMLGPGSPILGFSIQATIMNDTSLDVQWMQGDNSHGESCVLMEPAYEGPMVDVKLTAEFAIVNLNTLPAFFAFPYRETTPWIEAVNEDQAGWYCWSPVDQNPNQQPPGGYFVPTWDFGMIAPMQSATRQLQFVVHPPYLLPSDPRYQAIESPYQPQQDILLNRTTSLKISTWVDNLDLDLGMVVEEFPLRGSDVSVFHKTFV